MVRWKTWRWMHAKLKYGSRCVYHGVLDHWGGRRNAQRKWCESARMGHMWLGQRVQVMGAWACLVKQRRNRTSFLRVDDWKDRLAQRDWRKKMHYIRCNDPFFTRIVLCGRIFAVVVLARTWWKSYGKFANGKSTIPLSLPKHVKYYTMWLPAWKVRSILGRSRWDRPYSRRLFEQRGSFGSINRVKGNSEREN